MIYQIFYASENKSSHEILTFVNFNIKIFLKSAELIINQKAVIS